MGKPVFYINGEFFSQEKAKISIMDHGFLYGDGVFDAFRVNNRKVFHFDDHIDRLYNSAKIIDLEIPLSKEELKNIIINAVKKSGYDDCYIRPQVTRGIGSLGHNPDSCQKPTVVVYVMPTPQLKKTKAIRTIVSCYRRPSADIVPPESKLTQYMNNILAKIEARKSGADDAIILDTRGFVAEGCAWNIFLVKDGAVATPGSDSSILKGITRQVVIDLLRELSLRVVERNITLSELLTADELFGTGTASEITPIIEVNGRRIRNGEMGPITGQLDDMFENYIRNHGTEI